MLQRIPILMVLALAALLAQSRPWENVPERPTLRLETKLMSQGYCRTSDSIDVILNLQLRYTNTGQVPLILYRNSDQLLAVSRSASAADALAGKYEDTAYLSYVPFIYVGLVKGYEAFPPRTISSCCCRVNPIF